MNKSIEKKEFKKLNDYSLSDFSFSFKENKDSKQFKEIEVRYPYKDLLVSYYIFVAKEVSDEECLKFAKEKIKALLKNGKILYYAKHYYRTVH